MYWIRAARVDSTFAGVVTVIARLFCANAFSAVAHITYINKRIVFVMLTALACQIHSPYYARAASPSNLDLSVCSERGIGSYKWKIFHNGLSGNEPIKRILMPGGPAARFERGKGADVRNYDCQWIDT